MTISIEVGDGEGKIFFRTRKETFTSGWTYGTMDELDSQECHDEESFYKNIKDMIEGSDHCKYLMYQDAKIQVEHLILATIAKVKAWIEKCRNDHTVTMNARISTAPTIFDPNKDTFFKKVIRFPGKEDSIYCSYYCITIMGEKD